eukprot:scaffold2019_cov26-Tisochrysis_lutea.AAC.1
MRSRRDWKIALGLSRTVLAMPVGHPLSAQCAPPGGAPPPPHLDCRAGAMRSSFPETLRAAPRSKAAASRRDEGEITGRALPL